MKHAMWGYMFIALGLVIIAILFLVNNLTTSDEEDFYVAREVMQSAMTEATDYGTYLVSGDIVMSREKFVEIFLRRFAESVTPNKNYQVDFYQIYEYPPAATVRIRTTTGTTNVKDNPVNVDVDTILSAILVIGEDKKMSVVDVTSMMGSFNASLSKGNNNSITIKKTDPYITKINEIKVKYQNGSTATKSTKSGGGLSLTTKSNSTAYTNFEGQRLYNEVTYNLAVSGKGNISDNKNVIESITISYTKKGKDAGNYVSELKYTPEKTNNFTCIGVQKSN